MLIRRRMTFLLTLCELLAAAVCSAAPFAYVPNSGDNSVSVIDLATNAVVATVSVGSRPEAAAVHAGTARAYVSNAGSNSISVIDTVTNTVIDTVPLPWVPEGIAINPAGTRVYVTDITDGVYVIHTDSNAYIPPAIPVLIGPRNLAVTPDGSRVYVATDRTPVAVIDAATNTVASEIDTVDFPHSVAINAAGTRAYLAGASGDAFSVVDIATNAVISTVFFPAMTAAINGVVLNPAGTRAYFTAASGVLVYDLATNTYLGTVPTGSGTYGASFDPSGNRVYAVNSGSNTVSVIDADALAVTATIPVGTHPFGRGLFIDQAPASASKATSTITAGSSANPSAAGQAITLTGSVTGESGTPTGTIAFKDAGVLIGGCSGLAMTNGSATCSPIFTPGTHPITAVYSGDGVYYGATSSTLVQTANGATPTVSLSSSRNPSTINQYITFTAAISGGQGTPTGTVRFLDGADVISGCFAVALSAGSAGCATNSLALGTHSITAAYSGDATYNAGSGSLSQVVSPKETPSVTIGSAPNPSIGNQSVTFTVTVSGNQGIPTGRVYIQEGNYRWCTPYLSGGSATCSTAYLGTGVHSIIARYFGDAIYDGATSAPISQVVNPKGTPSITLGSTANPSTVGQYVTYTGAVSGSFGTPTGTIVFRDNGAIIGGCGGLVMTNGRATCTIGNQALGTHSMTAAYSGDSLYNGVTSSTLPQVVDPAKPNTPSITLGSSVNPSTVGQYVELTGVVYGAAGTPTGTLVFLDNGDTISGCGGLALTNGRATCTPGSLTQGTHSITTVYSGDSTYNGVTSSTLPQTVNAAKANTPSFTLGSSQNPSLAGNRVTFTAMLSGAAGTVTGKVVFRDNGLTISGCGGIALTNGSVTCTPPFNTVGTHSITGIYLGDANYNGITSSVLPQTVQ
jgi:YVTN family beta-propeller protein